MALVCLHFLCSCAKDSSGSADADLTPKSFSQRLSENHGYTVNKDGNWVPRNNKRSSFEQAGGSPYFQGELGKKEFSTTQFGKKSWWGNNELARPEFSSSADTSNYQQSSRYQGQNAGLDRSLVTPDKIQGSSYTTGTAHEEGGRRLSKPSDAETDVRRRLFIQPEIIDYKQQRDMSMKESKDMLGR